MALSRLSRFLRLFGLRGVCAALVGCAPSAGPPEAPWSILCEDGRTLDEVSANPRLLLTGLEDLELSELWLVAGEITKTSARRLARRDPPATVSNRRIPLSVWREGELVVAAPAIFLEPGGSYSLAALGRGELGAITVTTEPEPRLLRAGSGPLRPGGWVSYCTTPPERLEPEPEGAAEAFFEPSGGSAESAPQAPIEPASQSPAEPAAQAPTQPVSGGPLGGETEVPPWGRASSWPWRRGLAGSELLRERCVSFRASEGSEGPLSIPPASWGRWLVEPTPLMREELNDPVAEECGDSKEQGDSVETESCDSVRDAQGDSAEEEQGEEQKGAICEQGELAACVAARSGALELSLPAGFFGVEARPLEGEGPPLEWLGTLLAPGVVTLGPLEPFVEYLLRAARVTPAGVSEESALVQAGPPQGRPVLNEVLANPQGPEPQSEWIELVNVGAAAVHLAGFRLLDQGGETILPDVTLAPGEFGLMVREDYRADPALDVVPAPVAVPIRVPYIGKSGLANGGEALRLLDPEGRLVSSVPALGTRAGKSLARIDPWAPDAPASFVEHGGRGASPGAANVW